MLARPSRFAISPASRMAAVAALAIGPCSSLTTRVDEAPGNVGKREAQSHCQEDGPIQPTDTYCWRMSAPGETGHCGENRLSAQRGQTGMPARRVFLSYAGRVISHASPSGRQSKRISPFSWPRIMPSIMRAPKP
jgi:hypothetical protein